MYLKFFGMAAAVVLGLGMLSSTNIVQQPVMATNNDKCFSTETKDESTISRTCHTGDKSFEDLVKDFKRECKETTDNKEIRCSSSQTANGETDNIKNP